MDNEGEIVRCSMDVQDRSHCAEYSRPQQSEVREDNEKTQRIMHAFKQCRRKLKTSTKWVRRNHGKKTRNGKKTINVTSENILHLVNDTNSHVLNVESLIAGLGQCIRNHGSGESSSTRESVSAIISGNHEIKDIVEATYLRIMDTCGAFGAHLCDIGCRKTIDAIKEQQDKLSAHVDRLGMEVSSLKVTLNRFGALLTQMSRRLQTRGM